MFKQDTIAAISTPPGEGGIALIRISGPEALAVAGRIFQTQAADDISRLGGYTVHYGRFFDPAESGSTIQNPKSIIHNQEGLSVDDGLLTVFRAPRSYTGEDTAELSCHGGRATTARVLQLALQAGARLAEPGEFTRRAFLNGRLDLAQAEAVADLIRARTEAARRMARRQLDGALSQAVTSLKDDLIGILAAIEVTIDFSDEVGELEYEPLLARIREARSGVETLLATAERGRILREGLRVAIVGRPNVGKSSLLNALLRVDRAIVTPIAGTTRDLLEESANIQGIPIVLIDTAGIRNTHDVVERIGVDRAQAAATDADIVLVVLDATQGCTPEDQTLLAQLTSVSGLQSEIENRKSKIPNPLLYVLNKCDLIGAVSIQAAVEALRQTQGRSAAVEVVSALAGTGIDSLERAIVQATRSGTSGDAGMDTVVSNARHRSALEATLAGLKEAEQTTLQQLPGDFIAIDIRGALDALGQITGETVTEEIIHRIFHDFCVGK